MIVGEQDAPLLGQSRNLAEAIPGAELAVIPDAGHSPQFENTDAWWKALSGLPRVTAERRGPRMTEVKGHGGDLALAALANHGIDKLFTLSGGHIFPFYDAAVKGTTGDWRIVDVRHEQTATFAAEATAKLTRRPASPCSPPVRV